MKPFFFYVENCCFFLCVSLRYVHMLIYRIIINFELIVLGHTLFQLSIELNCVITQGHSTEHVMSLITLYRVTVFDVRFVMDWSLALLGMMFDAQFSAHRKIEYMILMMCKSFSFPITFLLQYIVHRS